MAIQLARAIGEQRKPISPFEGLADIITKTGEGITASIEKKQAAKQAKALKDQALKDAIAGNISVLPIKASAPQQAEYENFVKQNLPKLAIMQNSSNVTPAQYQDAVNNFKYALKDREIKYGEDYGAFEELYKRKEAGTHSVKEYEDFLTGTPDRIQKAETKKPVTEPTTPEYGKKELGIEYQPSIEESKEEISAPQEKTYTTEEPVAEDKVIKGQQGYFNLPFEEQKKIDTKKALEEKTTPVMPYMLDAAKGFLGKDFDFNYVRTTDTKKGGKEFFVDEDKLEKDAFYAANMFANPPEYAGNKEFELLNKGIERQAINELLKTHKMAELEQNPNMIAQAKFEIAYNKFKRDAAEKIYQDQLKLKEEREKGKGGGMTFNFGGGESKQDKYVDIGKYNTSFPAKSMYKNITANKLFENYLADPVKKKFLEKKLENELLPFKEDSKEYKEVLRKGWEKLTKNPSKVFKDKTVEEGWTEKEKENLKKYEGKKAISFNNKKEERVSFQVGDELRDYIPNKVIYDNNGSIIGLEVYTPIETQDGNYKRDLNSLEIIPMNQYNYEALTSNFGELFDYAKSKKVNLKYSQETKPATAKPQATKPQATKPAATETKRIKSDGSDLKNWSTSNEYEVGGKIYYYDKSTKQWQKK